MIPGLRTQGVLAMSAQSLGLNTSDPVSPNHSFIAAAPFSSVKPWLTQHGASFALAVVSLQGLPISGMDPDAGRLFGGAID